MQMSGVQNLFCLAAIAVVSISTLAPAQAQPEIVQNGYYIYDQINYFSPIGQVFTPTITSPVAISLDYADFNPLYGPNTLTVAIYKGAGNSGPLVASTTINLANGFSGMYPAYFTAALQAGTQYTVVPIDPTVRWAVGTDNVNPYPTGELLFQGGLDPSQALTFEVDAIPEPATAGLLVMGLGGLAVRGRRRLKSVLFFLPPRP